MRQLVTIRTISELIPIEGADRIELAKVDGWQCVVKKGDFEIGDLGLYFEIDSVLPSDDERFAFLESRKFRIKSMRLRGALSQGLLMPMVTMTDEECSRWRMSAETKGETLTEIMKVQKYEVPVPMGGEQKGMFPTHLVPKTDQERIQNIPEVLRGRRASEFEITEKLDGTSCTIFCVSDGPDVHGDVPKEMRINLGVCSRNWEMKLEDENVYARMLSENGLVDKLSRLERDIAIQGEIIGSRIQGNKYKRAQQEFYVFDIYDIKKQCYVGAAERMQLVATLGLKHVPVPSYEDLFKEEIPVGTIYPPNSPRDTHLALDVVLMAAEGKSMLFDTQREGLVFKSLDGKINFKAISNKFLLKNE